MQDKAGNTTWTAHTHMYLHPHYYPEYCLFQGDEALTQPPSEQHSSVKVAVGKNQRSHQSPHVQHDANPAGRDLHPHRRPLAGHCLVSRIRTVKEGKEKGSFAIFFSIQHTCVLSHPSTLFSQEIIFSSHLKGPFFQAVHTSLYKSTICKLVSQEGEKTTAAQKVFSTKSCQEAEIITRNL